MSSTALDTIVAPATPVGRSALAIVRIDGPRSAEILESLTRAEAPEPRVATLVRLHDLDECVAIRYVAPHSFTGNDLVELTLHGNPLLIEQVIRAVTSLGARFAEPGEFTERAVLNGKIDLVQAESIADLIAARTPLQAKLSLGNLEGVLSRKRRVEGIPVQVKKFEDALAGHLPARQVERVIAACRDTTCSS